MNGLIYLIGLIVVIAAILSFFGLRCSFSVGRRAPRPGEAVGNLVCTKWMICTR